MVSATPWTRTYYVAVGYPADGTFGQLDMDDTLIGGLGNQILYGGPDDDTIWDVVGGTRKPNGNPTT